MSAEPDLNEDFRLPEELGVVEAALRGFSPTSGNLNRDDLMYQSGWAAAKASDVQRTHWLIPMLAGAAATLLLVFVWQPVNSPDAAESNVLADSPADAAMEFEQIVQAPEKLPPSIAAVRPRTTVYRRAVDFDWEEYVAAESPEFATQSAETNHRELLKKLLSGEES